MINYLDNAHLHELIEKNKLYIKKRFENLIKNIPQEQTLKSSLSFPDFDTREDAIWTLLLHTSYPYVTSSYLNSNGQIIGSLGIPNWEVRTLYKTMIKALESGDVEDFLDHIHNYVASSVSFFYMNENTPENGFHVFMLGFLAGLQDTSHITSNRESGLGRYDMILSPKTDNKREIVLEFKTSKTKEDKNYAKILQEKGAGEILLIGMSFWGKQMEAAHKVFL